MQTKIFKIECAKCDGKGEIKAFSGILGGRCFACSGKGHFFQKTSPIVSFKWAIYVKPKNENAPIRIFNVKAKTEKEAIMKAQNTLVKLDRYDIDTVRAEKW